MDTPSVEGRLPDAAPPTEALAKDERMRSFLPRPVILVLTLLLLAACAAGGSAGPGSTQTTPQARCVTDYRAGTDYFPAKHSVSAATNFTLDYHLNYKVLRVRQPNPTEPPAAYVLVQCGTPAPTLTGDLAGATVVTVPVARIAASTSPQLAALELLGRLDALAAVVDSTSIVSERATALVRQGTIATVGAPEGGYDPERTISVRPELALEGGFAAAAYGKLRAGGIATVAEGSWLESTPLGRAEWIAYYAAFLNEEARATTLFSDISRSYTEIATRARTASPQPTVLVGTEYQGVWTVPTSGSYVARLVGDAGGAYAFADLDGTGTKKVDNELVLAKGATAQVWLNGNWMSRTRWRTAADMLAADPRVATLRAVQDGAVWNPTKRISTNGGNDFWETGSLRPDLVLADLAAVLHPDLFPDHQMQYYAKLPR